MRKGWVLGVVAGSLVCGCRNDPAVPSWHEGVVHGPVVGVHEFGAFFADAPPPRPVATALSRADSAALTFSFALPAAVKDAPLAFDLELLGDDGEAATACQVELTQLNRPPRLPAMAVGTVSPSRSRCTDDGETLRPGRYRGVARAGGRTFASSVFQVE